MSQIKREDFVALLSSKVGAFPVGIVTQTEPKMRKTGNPFLGAVRTTRRNVFLGGNYESIVNNAKERAGESRDFEAGSLPWGTAVNRFLIENKGKLYLRYFPVVNGAKGEDKWTLNGEEIPVEKVQPFLYESAPSNGAGVEWRTVALENVKTVQMDGEEYILA
jgi:hypothetical protein